MKTLTLKLGDKTYTTGRITAWQAREAIAVNKDAVEIEEKSKQLNENDLESVKDLLQAIDNFTTRRASLICDVFGNKFTIDELEKSLTPDEIQKCFNDIATGIYGVVEKN